MKKLFNRPRPDDIGETHIAWSFPEYVKRHRTNLWYIIVIGVVSVFLIYAIYSANFMFAIIILLSIFIFAFQLYQEPRTIDVVIAEDGITLNDQYYSFKQLKSFSIIYEPPEVKFLYLDFKNNMKKHIALPLEDTNPLQIRDILLNYLEEDLERDQESIDQIFERVMRMR